MFFLSDWQARVSLNVRGHFENIVMGASRSLRIENHHCGDSGPNTPGHIFRCARVFGCAHACIVSRSCVYTCGTGDLLEHSTDRSGFLAGLNWQPALRTVFGFVFPPLSGLTEDAS